MGLVVVDIETTGLSNKRHRITEIAAALIDDDGIIDEFHTLVNPGVPIPGFITGLTGITDEMVRYEPPIQKVLPYFLDFLADNVIIAHNATFDCNFLSLNAERHCGCNLPNSRICTRMLANRLLPGLPSKKLSVLCEHFDIHNEQAHRARADVLATIDLFERFREMLAAHGICDTEGIIEFQNRPVSRIALQ